MKFVFDVIKPCNISSENCLADTQFHPMAGNNKLSESIKIKTKKQNVDRRDGVSVTAKKKLCKNQQLTYTFV